VNESAGAEVVVVGAGPAGSATAFHLARHGRDVVLVDRRPFPRDKSCGDGLTPPAVQLLDEMGVLEHLGQRIQRVRGVRVHVRHRGHRDFVYPEDVVPNRALVVPRQVLDDVIRMQAVAAGARFVPALVDGLVRDGDRVAGVEIRSDGVSRRIGSRVVVAADGAAGRLVRLAGLVRRDAPRPGFAIRGYYDGIDDLEDLLEIHLPLLARTGRHLLPSYGWVFPTGPRSANVGVGLVEESPHLNIRQLMADFVDRLRSEDGRFASAARVGDWFGAPLRFDFVPEKCVGDGILAVGDAAGTISPFTGEGISYALESAKLAAEVIHRNLRSQHGEGTPDLDDYRLLLEQSYLGYFETGRRATRRYLLAWNVLDATFHNERPVFALARRAALFPEGVGHLYASRVLDDVAPLVPRSGLRVREDLLAVGEILIGTVRRDWPFVARLAAAGRGDPGIPFRPALLLLLAGHFGDPRKPALRTMGAAVELGFLSALAQSSVGDAVRRGADDAVQDSYWANTFAIVIGDFLLAKAYALACQTGDQTAVSFADAMSRVCEGRLEELHHAHDAAQSEDAKLDALRHRAGAMFEFACAAGAEIAGAPATDVTALREYGRSLAIAFELADDVRALTGSNRTLGRSVSTELEDGLYPIPVLKVLRSGGLLAATLSDLLARLRDGEPVAASIVELVSGEDAISRTLDDARAWTAKARSALATLPETPARIALARLAAFAVDRASASDGATTA
jgi:geranylgeranyl reductase family protein